MIIENLIVQKGRHLIAQVNALGLETINEIVRANMFIKEKSSFRTKGMIACFPENDVLQFRPKQNFHILYFSLADGFFGESFTRGGAPGYAILPFQGTEIQKFQNEKNRIKY